tara:strand:+ start:198 stop:629 length:432 start_codon:yes stop_codon:yes gene_type:complete
MGIFDWLFNKDILTDNGINEIYHKTGKKSLMCKFYKKNGLLDGEYIHYQGEYILMKGQFKDNLMHGEWYLWAWNNDNEDPGCVEKWENGYLKSVEILYDYFLKRNMKGKYTSAGKKSIIASELYYYTKIEIKNITKSNKIEQL